MPADEDSGILRDLARSVRNFTSLVDGILCSFQVADAVLEPKRLAKYREEIRSVEEASLFHQCFWGGMTLPEDAAVLESMEVHSIAECMAALSEPPDLGNAHDIHKRFCHLTLIAEFVVFAHVSLDESFLASDTNVQEMLDSVYGRVADAIDVGSVTSESAQEMLAALIAELRKVSTAIESLLTA